MVVQEAVGGGDLQLIGRLTPRQRRSLRQSVVPARRPFLSSEDDGSSDHGADRVQVGVEAHRLALHGFGVGVVHGVLEGSLAVVVLVDRAARVLGLRRGPVRRRTHGTTLRRQATTSDVLIQKLIPSSGLSHFTLKYLNS